MQQRRHTRAYMRVLAHTRGRWINLALVLVILVATFPAMAPAFVSTTITVDGQFVDWAPVFGDGQNAMSDPVGAADDPVPGTADRDVSMVASTWDSDYLYLYFRRTTTGKNQVEFFAWVDAEGDGVLSSANDRVVDVSFNGSSPRGVSVYRYDDNGAPYTIGGNGSIPPGQLGSQITLVGQPAMQQAAGADGLEFEARIPWAYFGVPAGSPVGIKYGVGQNTNLPGGIQDVTGGQSMRRRGLGLYSDSNQAVATSSTVIYEHTLTNTGNDTDTIDVSATSGNGFATTIRSLPGGTEVGSFTLGPGQSATFTAEFFAPSDTPDGTRDVMTVKASSRGDPSVTAIVTDSTFIGQVLVIPDITASIAPGLTLRFRNVITNTTDVSRTVALSATSAHGWPVTITDGSGTAMTSAVLAPRGSLELFVDVSVPSTATIGTSDITSLYAVDTADPVVRGHGEDTTLVRKELSVTPDNPGSAGPNTFAWYKHTVTNSGTSTRTVSLESMSVRGWPTVVLDSTRVNQITSLTLPPFGGARDVWLRVQVPAGTAEGMVDTETVTARFGALSDTASDSTTCSRLGTFGSSSFTDPKTTFTLGDTVYVRATGLPGGSKVNFKWYDSTNTLRFTSVQLGVDTQGMTWSSYVPPVTGPAGTWTVAVVGSGGAEIARTRFVMAYDAEFTALTASDALAVGATVSVDATLTNSGGLSIDGSRVDYRVWWDNDGDGVFASGDVWYDGTGAERDWTGSADDRTHSTDVDSFAAATTWSDPGWELNNGTFGYSGVYRVTATWYAADGTVIDTRQSTFESSFYELSLTLTSNDVSFGTVDPGTTMTASPVGLSVASTLIYDLATEFSGDAAEMGLTTTLGDKAGESSGIRDYTDVYSISIPWMTDPGIPLQGSVTYTVIAH